MIKKRNTALNNMKRIFFLICCLSLLIGCSGQWVPDAFASSDMTASKSCVKFIKEVEGFSPQPYYDYSQYTVGYGTKCPDDKFSEYMSNGISKEEAEELLEEELAEIEKTLNEKLIDKYNLSFEQHEFDALVSFSYNIGAGWTTYDSTLRSAILNHADENEFVYAFGLYCTAGGKYLPGLITRRLCEANMFLNNVYSQTVSDDYGYVYYDANGGTLTYRVQGFICNDKTKPAADATRDGVEFLGWYTDLTGGSEVSVLNRSLTGKTLFARWESSHDEEDQDSISVTVKVTGDVVNIRSGPGTSYGVVKQISKNSVLTVSHVTHLTTMRWGKVEGGWISLDYTNYDDVINEAEDTDEEVDTPSDEDSGWTGEENSKDTVSGVVNVNNYLNIRSGPGTGYSTVGFLYKNDKVEILQQKKVGSTVWGQIAKGWVCMDFIVTDSNTSIEDNKPNENPESEKKPIQNTVVSTGKIKGTINADALRIRSGAGTSYNIVGFYYQNDSVIILEKTLIGSVYWGKTDKGWISMDYVLAQSSDAESSQPDNNDQKTVIADCLRVRKDAGTDQKIVSFLYYGDTVSVLETKKVDGTLWGRVKQGWICMTYVT